MWTGTSRALIATLGVLLVAPAASFGASGEASFEWGMPSRFGWSQDERGRIVEAQPFEVRRGPWRVYLRVTGPACARGAGHHWRRDGARLIVDRLGPCRYAASFPREGDYTVRLDATVGGRLLRGAERVTVEDLLIVSIGDSVASGEAVPDVRHPFHAVWQSVRCHRSARSAHALAAKLIEADDRHSSVTFVHLACSGAGISHGLLGPYDGAEPPEEPPLEPQVSALKKIAQVRPVDAVLLSAGANDAHFGDVVRFCAKPARDCFEERLPPAFGGSGTRSLRDEVRRALRRLPHLYRRLAVAISPRGKRSRIPPSRVYAVEYFDPTRDGRGQTCPKILVSATARELEHTQEEVLRPLNATLAAAAETQGWQLVDGVADLFREHGYCAGRQAWVTDLRRSFAGLGGTFKGRFLGTLHPTAAGHEASATLIAAALEEDLYPGRDFPDRPLPTVDLDAERGDDDGRAPLSIFLSAVLLPLAFIPALAGLTVAALGWLLWLGSESVSPFVVGFAVGALILALWPTGGATDGSKRAGQTFVTLAKTARPLVLPFLVALVVASSALGTAPQIALAAAALVVAWKLIVLPEAERSGERPRWQWSFAGKLALNTLVALAVGFALVLVAKVAGLVHPYFRAIDDVASGLFLIAIALLTIALLLRLVSFATTPLRGAIALLLGLALYALAGAAGLVPEAKVVDDEGVRIARDLALAALAGLALDTALGVAYGAEQKRRGQFWSQAAKLGLSAALVSAVVLAVSTGWGMVEASKDERALNPPERQLAEISSAAPGLAGAEADLELARRFAPVFAFSADERWAPTSVDAYVEAATLEGPPTEADGLPAACPEAGETNCYELSIGCDKAGDPPPAAAALCEGEIRERGRLYRDGALYFRVLEEGRRDRGESRGVFVDRGPFGDELRTLIQYWLFYPYNEWRTPVFAGELVQRHEADWEAVTIGLDERREPLFIADSAHCRGSWVRWEEAEASTRLPGPRTHPLVAVALGSHANYQDPEEKRSPDWTSCANGPEGVVTALSYASNIRDETEFGWLWHPPADGWLPARRWEQPMSFPGRWGADDRTILKNFKTNDLHTGPAPRTPTFQALWREPIETIFCGRYEPRACDRDR